MIYPSVYNFNAPYRGPKESKEVNKLFTSIVYDISVAYDEMEAQESQLPDNLRFCILSDIEPHVKIPTAGLINGSNYSYIGSAKLSQNIDEARMRADYIIENL